MEHLLQAIIAWSIDRRQTVLIGVFTFVLVCIFSLQKLRFDAFPDITNTQVQVVTGSPGLSSLEVEQLITLPIERSLGGVPGVIEQRSLSRAGVSSITVVFEEGTDLWLARQLVKERLDSAREEIPPDAGTPELGPPSTGLGEVFQFTLQSDRHPLPELYRIFERDLAPRLRSVSGVVEVNAWGGSEPQLEVLADPALMSVHHVSFEELEHALSDSIVRSSGGAMIKGAEQLVVRAESAPNLPETLAQIPLRRGLTIGDLADTREGGALTVGLGSHQGQGEALFVMVQMLAGADALSVVDALKQRTEEVIESLPQGVQLHVIYDRSKLVHNALKTVARSLTEGGLLVIIVLLLLLGDFRAGLLVSSIIPLSLLGALAGLAWTGVTGNLMSLGAIDFGLVVDGAIVVTESMIAIDLGRALHHGLEGHDGLKTLIKDRVSRVAGPVSLAILILCLVYTPILSLWGTEGKLFRPMALTVLFALIVAFILSFTYIPALATWIIKPKGEHQTYFMRALKLLYSPLLDVLLRHPVLGLMMVMILTISSLFAGSQLGVEFVPRLEEGDLIIQSTRLPSLSPEQALKDGTRLEQVLLRFPEVIAVSSRMGSPAVATDPMGLEQADVFIKLKPRSEWITAKNTEELTQAFSEALETESLSAQIGFSQPIEMRFNELLEGVTADVGVKVFGPDLQTLTQIGSEIASILEGLPGASDVKRPDQEGVASLSIELNPARLFAYGLKASDIARFLQGIQRGIEVGQVRRGLFQDSVILKLKLAQGQDLNQLAIPLPQGGVAPLSELAQVRPLQVPVSIEREVGSRKALVQVNVRGRDLGSFVREAQTRVKKIELPAGYWIVWCGQYAQLEEASGRMMLLIPSILLMILGLLYLAFKSLKVTALIALNMPVAMSGGLISLWLTDTSLSLSAVIGCVALFGIAVMNGVVLLSRTQVLQNEFKDAHRAARESALERLRPVFTTALVAGLGFVPMALAQGVGAEVQRPLALVVIGGIISSTTLTLLTLPSLYAWVFSSSKSFELPEV